MKKLIKPILIVLAIVALVVGIAWLISRHKAAKEGKAALGFREFVSTDTGATGPDTTGTTLDGQFTVDTNGDGILDAGGTGRGNTDTQIDPGTRTSTFTGSSINPTNTGSTGTGSTGTPGSTTPGSGTGTTDPNGTVTTSTQPGVITVPNKGNNYASYNGCTQADLNITFTQEELDKLHALQDRFYTIAQSLHSDADTKTQIANYDAFVLKYTKLNELLNYCTDSKLPASKKVPTPFWWEESEVRYNGYKLFNPLTGGADITDTGVPLGYVMDSGQLGGKIDSTYGDIDVTKRSMERILRLNLW
jgi:hypothetical protein